MASVVVDFFVALLGGLASFLSPCSFSLLLALLTYTAAVGRGVKSGFA